MSARRLVVKELKALAVPWLACVGGMIGGALMGREVRGLSILAYFLGAPALGALAIGHEYTCRTLPMLLAQPVERRRLLATKLGVVAGLLAVTAAIAALSPFGTALTNEFGTGPERLVALGMPVICGLTWAPFLTMVCRNPVAGAVFAMGLPGFLFVVGELIGVKVLGIPDVDAFRFAFFVQVMPVLCAYAAVMTWRTFSRLEAIEGGGAEVRLPRWLRARSGEAAESLTRRDPIWLLAKKEVRLQPMTFALAGLYVCGWLVANLWPPGSRAMEILHGLTFFYSVSVALIVGSNASAEERQLGTLPSQLLLPVAVSTQWAVKVAVALALSLVVTIALPALLAIISPSINMTVTPPTRLIGLRTLLSVLFTVAGLYVSSLSTGGVRALMASLPALAAAGLFVRYALSWSAPWAVPLAAALIGPASRVGPAAMSWIVAIVAAVVSAVMLAFALANHRSADRPPRRMVRQALWVAACLALSVVILGGLDGL